MEQLNLFLKTFIYQFIWKVELHKEKNRDLPSTGSLCKWPQWLGLGQGGARSSIWFFRAGDKVSSTWAIVYFPRALAGNSIKNGAASTYIQVATLPSRPQFLPHKWALCWVPLIVSKHLQLWRYFLSTFLVASSMKLESNQSLFTLFAL